VGVRAPDSWWFAGGEERFVAERETTVGPEEGLHARPAAQFVKAAKQFSSDIVVVKGDREANAKSSLKIMTLGAKKGDSIVIRAEGDDAQEAVDALAELISADEH
jgi:phosphocarrier protein HPr